MQPNSAPPANINWPAIHAAYAQHSGMKPQAATVPQPEQNGPGYSMMVHAMSQAPTEPGQDHGTMVIKALSDHLKRTTPDVSSIHKDTMKPNTGGGAY